MLEIRINRKLGKIGRMLVKVGDMVNSGDPILSIEVAKSHVIIKANFTGEILSINKTVGDLINPEDIVFTVNGVVVREAKDIIVTSRD